MYNTAHTGVVCSGPIMPRINECLAGRLTTLPDDGVETCPAGCIPVSSGTGCGGWYCVH